MKIKKYIAKTMPEAMNEIRKDFGREAVILQSREIKQKGFLGLFPKRRLKLSPHMIPNQSTVVQSPWLIKRLKGNKRRIDLNQICKQ